MAMTRPRRSIFAWGPLAASAVVLLFVAESSLAQVFVARKPVAQQEDIQNVFLPPDRPTLRKLTQSRKLIEDGQYDQAVRLLGDILEEPEDYFFRPDEKTTVFRSLKAEAERLIGQMPRKGRDMYELQYGAQAQKMLTDALGSGDVSRLAEISRRFFHTSGGYQATFLLGLYHFDHGRPLAGALVLKRLYEVDPPVKELEPGLSLSLASCWLQAGMPDKAREILVAMRQRDPAGRVTVAGKEVPLFTDDSKAVDWLAKLIGSRPKSESLIPNDWLMFRGNPARNASTDGGAPLLNLRWRVDVTEDPMMQSLLVQYRNRYLEQGLPTIPMLQPLVVGDVVLMRTLRNLLAVDFNTGKRLWEVPVDDPLDSASAPNFQQQQQAAAALGAGRRMWGDLTFGTFSSDEKYVFSVEDLGMEFGDDADAMQQIIILGRAGGRNGRTNVDSLCNRLTAHDIRTGKLVWELGGPEGPQALRQADSFFLGPPLPLMGRLYVMAETSKGEVRLLALDPSTGDLLWSQQLSLTEESVLDDLQRRWAGVSPSYADGVLVCPTSTGAVVGVELATRALLWGFCYNQEQNENRFARSSAMMAGPAFNRWVDDGVTIRDGRVLFTPQDSNWLYCLNLMDGEVRWKSPRDNNLYVACTDDEKVVLVGTGEVRALRLDDGKPAWHGHAVSLPKGSTPSGRGFLSGDRYFLPLSNAEVVAVNLAKGEIDSVSKSHSGTVPGNLVCHKGIIISQGIRGLDAFFQLDLASAEVEQRLKANPDDTWALSLRGEIELNGDQRSQAIASFRRAYELDPDPRTRKLLRDTLLEGLRSEFAAYRGREAEIERLLDGPKEQARFLRLMAAGLRGDKQWADAFEYYMKLVDLEPKQQPLDQIEKTLVVRRDRWVQGQLTELRKEAKDKTAAQIDQFVSARLKTALASDSTDRLRRFLDNFGGLPAAAGTRDELVLRLKSKGELLEAELLSPPVDPAADSAAGKKEVEWPQGNVEVSTKRTKNFSGFGNRYFTVDLQGNPGPYFRDLAIKYDYSRREIVAFDDKGEEKWKVSLSKEGEQQNFQINFSTMHARAVGHLLLVAMGWNIFAIDTTGQKSDDPARLLWTQDLTNPSLATADMPGLGQIPMQLAALPPQLRIRFINFQNQSNMLGPANNNYICIQRFQNLAAVDPRNGHTLWVRENMPSLCDVFGDREQMFLLSTDKEEAELVRASDGALLGTRKIPRQAVQRRLPTGKLQKMYMPLRGMYLAEIGRKLLYWWPAGSQREMTLFDPLEGRDEWPRRKFPSNSLTAVLDDEAVGVLERNGRFVLISIADGRTLAEVKLEAEPSLMNFSLFKSGKEYFLLTNARLHSGHMPPIQPMPNQQNRSVSAINRGRLYAFDSQGKLLWPAPVKVEKQILLADQPSALPVVVFGCQEYHQKPNGQGKWKPRLLCIDKRSGRVVYQGEFNDYFGFFDLSCDIAKKTVTLTTQKDTVTLTYTDKAIPPPAPADAKADKSTPGGKITHALWNSIQKAIVPDFDPFGDDD